MISVKDFKAIVTHAETLKATISAHFSFPTRPLQFSYQNSGVHCEFTLMTTGDYRAASSTPIPNFVTTRSSSRQPSIARVAAPSRSVSEMPPPARPTVTLPHPSNQSQRPPLSQLSQRPSLSQSFRSARVEAPDPDPESLFVPGDDDQVWNPPEYENEEEEMLGWDASNEDPRASFHPTFTDSSTVASKNKTTQASAHASQGGIEPTQRLSQVCVERRHGYVVIGANADHSCTACSTEICSAVLRPSLFGLHEARCTASEDCACPTRHANLIPPTPHISMLVYRSATVTMLAPAPS